MEPPISHTSDRLRSVPRTLAVLVLAAGGIVAAGCGDGTTAGTATTHATTAGTSATAEATVFFMNSDATGLIRSARTVADTGAPLRNAMDALASGPADGGTAALPPGTRVLGADVEDGGGTVDFDRAFAAGYPSGGAAAEIAVVAPIVFTATAVQGVERVRILVEGATPDLTGTLFDWSRPFTRADLPDMEVTEA